MADLFDAAPMYDADYLHFWGSGQRLDDSAPAATPRGDAVADLDLAWQLLDLAPGMRVLDLCCGHGVLANGLAGRGCEVTGLDFSTVLLDRARSDAAALGVEVTYVEGDTRDLPWSGHFDRVVNWSTAFGYFDDDTNHRVLDGIARVLRPGGRLAMDLNNMTSRIASFQPSRIAEHPDGSTLTDRFRLDPLTSRLLVTGAVVRDGRVRRVPFVVRLFGFPELRDWLLTAGFTQVSGYGEDGEHCTG